MKSTGRSVACAETRLSVAGVPYKLFRDTFAVKLSGEIQPSFDGLLIAAIIFIVSGTNSWTLKLPVPIVSWIWPRPFNV